jgi:hypothetical protein
MAVEPTPGDQGTFWSSLSPAEQKKWKERTLRGEVPGKVQPAKAKPLGQFELVGYIRCDLGKSDRDPFRTWQEGQSDAALFDMLVKLCDSGYLLKCGVGKEGHQAVLSACDTNTEWDGYVLSAFAGEGRDSLALLLYKHHVLLEGDWSTSMGGSGKSGLR